MSESESAQSAGVWSGSTEWDGSIHGGLTGPTGLTHAHPSTFGPSVLQVRSIVMENMGGDAKVADYLKANGDDKAEFSEMGFDSLGT